MSEERRDTVLVAFALGLLSYANVMAMGADWWACFWVFPMAFMAAHFARRVMVAPGVDS